MTLITSSDSLRALVSPESVAVVGATRTDTIPNLEDTSKISARLLHLLKIYNYRGEIFPVNPKHQEVDGLRCYPTVSAIDHPLDVALVAVPQALVEAVVADCCAAGTRAVIVYAGGFAELNEAGAAMQSRLVASAKASGTLLCGPNCQGVANFHSNFVANFARTLFHGTQVGNLAVIGQSGMMGGLLFRQLQESGIGIGYLCATGNEAGVEASQIAEYLAQRPEVGAVIMFIERMGSGDAFSRAARTLGEQGKAFCVLKTGRSPDGVRAARSHTAALEMDETIFDAACRRFGVIRVEDFQELHDAGLAFGSGVARARGNRIAIVSETGGMGVLMSDLANSRGMNVPRLEKKTMALLNEVIPEFVPKNNPVDLSAAVDRQQDRYRDILVAVAQDDNVDQVFPLLSLPVWVKRKDETVQALLEAKRQSMKPIIVTWPGAPPEIVGQLRGAGIPTFDDPSRSMRLGQLLIRFQHADLSDRGSNQTEPDGPMTSHPLGDESLWDSPSGEGLSAEVFNAYGLRLSPSVSVRTADEAVGAAKHLGYPVALKVSSSKLVHKSDAGAVRLGLASSKELKAALSLMSSLISGPDDCFVVQKMVPKGIEIFLACKRDPTFGPVLLVGSGGIYFEAWHDLEVIVPPIERGAIRQALAGLIVGPMLVPFRGQPGADIEAVESAAIGLHHLFARLPSNVIVLEINPLIVGQQGYGSWVVDWRLETI